MLSLLSLAVIVLHSSGASQAAASEKLLSPLPALLAVAAADEKVPAYVVGVPTWTLEEIQREVGGLSRGEKRAFLGAELRARHERALPEVLAFLDAKAAAGEVEIRHSLWSVNAVVFRGTPATIEAVAGMPGVLYVAYDAPRSEEEVIDIHPPLSPPPAPLGGTIPPNVQNIGAPTVWSWGITGQGIVVANADSGTAANHPDLASQIWNNVDEIASNGIDDDGNGFVDDTWGWDFDANDNNPSPSGSSHGTNTAGIVVGNGTQGTQTGIAPGAKMMVLRIGNAADQMAAIQYAIDNDADVVTSSHSYKWPFIPKPDYHLHRMVEDNALVGDLVHTNSIGNQGTSLASYPIPWNISAPGNSPSPWRHPQDPAPATGGDGVSGVLACGGVQVGDLVYAVSGHGPSAWENILIYDPAYPHPQNPAYFDYPYGGFGGSGPGILKPDVCGFTLVPTTTGTSGYTTSFSGTSAATPHVGGCAVLVRSANPSIPSRKVAQALQQTALDLGPAGKDNDFGAGRARVDLAVRRVLCSVLSDTLEPPLGSSFSVTIHGPAGKAAALWYGKFLGTTTVAGSGSVEVTPPLAFFFLGTLPASGEVVVPLGVPNVALLSGMTFHFQGVVDDTTGVTGGLLASLVETITIP
jgi:subtilisin family serine protease